MENSETVKRSKKDILCKYQKLKSCITPRLEEIWKIKTHYPSVLAPFGKHFDISIRVDFAYALESSNHTY